MANESTKKVNPKDLYREYRMYRSGVPDDVGTSESRAPAEATETITKSEYLYRAYRQTRVTDREARINAIVTAIQEEAAEHSVDPINAASEERVTRSGSWLTRIFTLPGDLLGKAAGSSISKGSSKGSTILRYGVPALAAGVLAVLVVPMMISKPVESNFLPDSLNRHATSISRHVDVNGAAQFGFASGESPEKLAFKSGVISTDIAVLGEADSSKEVDKKLSTLKSQLASLKSSAPDRSDLWFQQGTIVESIALAAEYALESGDTEPLTDAMHELKSSKRPEPGLAVDKLLDELRSLPFESALEISAVRTILDKTDNIKILVQ